MNKLEDIEKRKMPWEKEGNVIAGSIGGNKKSGNN